MTSPRFDRAVPGAPMRIPAETYNAMLDAAKANLEGRSRGGVRGSMRDPTEVLIKNATVTDHARYDVMGVSIPLFGPSDNITEFLTNLCMQGVACDGVDHVGRWAVLMGPLAADQIGGAVISGDTIAKIDVLVESDTHVECNTDPTDTANFYRLQSGTTGSARILWKESGTGADKWAYIRIGDSAGGGATTGGGATPMRITEIYVDHLICRTWDGSANGADDIVVAKPFLLRHTQANYPWIDAASLASVDAQTLTVEVSTVEYTWKVAVPYAVDEVLWASPTTLADVTVGYVDALWEDTNRNAHAWAEVQA